MLTTFITFILVLGLLVFVHELGHFAAAKFFGVNVKEFAIGFPPRLSSFEKDGTKYSINLIPLGGYVSIKGEGGDFKEEEDSFSNKPAWQRAIILAAGVIMNFITAILLLSFGFMAGLPVSVENPDALGPYAKIREENIQIFQLLEGAPAEKAGLQMGDSIVSVDGQQFAEIEEVQNFIGGKDSQTLMVEIKRGDETFTKEIIPEYLEKAEKSGIGVALVKSGVVSYPAPVALWEGTKRTFGITTQIFYSLGDLVKSWFSPKEVPFEVAGPVGIAVLTGQASKLGFVYLMQFTALLSVNLAIINLLPFPALDGGRIFLLAIEKLRGRALNENFEGMIHAFGFAILMLLMLVVTFQDLLKYGSAAWQRIFG